MLLGYLTGKTRVRCDECKNLDAQNLCCGHPMPEDIVHKPIACGFWSKKPI
jgi:hypothetical protein